MSNIKTETPLRTLSDVTQEEYDSLKVHDKWQFIETPKPVGWWHLGSPVGQGVAFAVYTKPTPEQIANTEQTFGWIWRDET